MFTRSTELVVSTLCPVLGRDGVKLNLPTGSDSPGRWDDTDTLTVTQTCKFKL